MSLIDGLLIIGVAIVCGMVGQMTSGFSHRGWIMYMALAFIGAGAGVVISRSLSFPIIYDLEVGLTHFPILWAMLGAVAFVAAINFVLRPRRY